MCSCLCIIYLLMFTFYFYFVLLCADICPCSWLWFWWLEVNIEQVRRVLKQTSQETSYYHKTCVLTDCFLALLAPCFQKDKVHRQLVFSASFLEGLLFRTAFQLLGSSSKNSCSTWFASMFGLFKKSARGWVNSATTSWSPRTCWATSAWNLSINEQLSFLRARDLVYVKWCDMLEEWLSEQWDWMYQLELRLQTLEKSMKSMKAELAASVEEIPISNSQTRSSPIKNVIEHWASHMNLRCQVFGAVFVVVFVAVGGVVVVLLVLLAKHIQNLGDLTKGKFQRNLINTFQQQKSIQMSARDQNLGSLLYISLYDYLLPRYEGIVTN